MPVWTCMWVAESALPIRSVRGWAWVRVGQINTTLTGKPVMHAIIRAPNATEAWNTIEAEWPETWLSDIEVREILRDDTVPNLHASDDAGVRKRNRAILAVLWRGPATMLQIQDATGLTRDKVIYGLSRLARRGAIRVVATIPRMRVRGRRASDDPDDPLRPWERIVPHGTPVRVWALARVALDNGPTGDR